jgi:LysM repeat protein
MSRFRHLLFAAAACAIVVPAALAEDTQAAQELRELREAVRQQARQIETLTQQLAKLSLLLEGREMPKTPAASSTAPTEIAKPAPAEPATPPAEIPKAEAVPQPVKHTVEKGETLTSIAKHYNVPLADLQKHNKIENDRKLQIGQTLIIPTTKTPEPSTEKKENP